MLESMSGIMLAASSISWDARQIVTTVFAILMLIAAIAIIVIIMMQKGTSDNVGVITGASDTFYGRNKEKGKEGILKKITFGIFAFIIVCAIICFTVSVVD